MNLFIKLKRVKTFQRTLIMRGLLNVIILKTTQAILIEEIEVTVISDLMVRFMHCINQLIKKNKSGQTSLQSIFAVNLGFLCRSIKIGLIGRTCLCFLLKRTLLPWGIHAQWPSCCRLFTSSELCSFTQRPSPAHVFPPLVDVMSCWMIWVSVKAESDRPNNPSAPSAVFSKRLDLAASAHVHACTEQRPEAGA